MNIALDATPLSVSTGGVARYTAELARALAARFPENEYWLVSDQPFSLPDQSPANLHRGSTPGNVVARKWWLWGLQQEMIRRGVSLFHGTDFSVPYLPLRPSVMTIHDLSPWLDPLWQPDAGRIRRRTPLLLRAGLAAIVITPSQAIRSEAMHRFRLPADRVIAVPLAASEHFRPVAVEPAGTPYFLFTGTQEPRKNLASLVEAWREVRKTHTVDLVLAGRTRADFAPFGPEPGLQLRGEAAEADLPALYSGALAVVYPSLYEGFGLPVLEAMQCGAVVVASRDLALIETTGGAAVHVDAHDTRALAQALAAIAEAPSSFDALRERAIARARDFSWTRTAELTSEVYDTARKIFRK
ncbi:MAG: glycosyltransferase family 4 protein [Bryobacteraceae bacterium]